MTRRRAVYAAVIAAIGAGFWWYLFGGRHVPAGQPPLATLTAANLETLRADFNRDADKVRIIVLLAPT